MENRKDVIKGIADARRELASVADVASVAETFGVDNQTAINDVLKNQR